jgi:ABC-type branched-subunit amino acid transport system substrate-binding protein
MGRKTTALAIGLLFAVGSAAAAADKTYAPGVSDSEIKLGQSIPYSGPASAFSPVGRVQVAYFKMLNAKGGINGRKVELTSLDNGFSPPKALEASRKLVEEIGVLAEAGTLGTPTNLASQKYLNGKRVPQLYVSAGATRFNDPRNFPWTVPWYTRFEMESRIYAKYILQNKPNARIAVLYQNDDFGRDYLTALKKRLGDKAARMIVAEASYELSDPQIDSQMIALKASGADTLLAFVTPKFSALAIRKAFELDWRPLYFVNQPGSAIESVIKPAGVEKALGLITAQLLKDPGDPAFANDADVVDYNRFMATWAPGDNAKDTGAISGYVTAQGIELVLSRCGEELTRDNVLKQATTLNGVRLKMLLPGMTLSNSPGDYVAFRQYQLARFDGQGWVLMGELITAD